MSNTTPEPQTAAKAANEPQGPLNLDLLCFQKARECLETIRKGLDGPPKKDDWKAVDRAVTETLGVLQEDGTFACAVFIAWRIEREHKGAAGGTHRTLRDAIPGVLATLDSSTVKCPDADGSEAAKTKQLFTCMERLAGDLDHLLLGCQVLERFLIYVRYLAKGQPGA